MEHLPCAARGQAAVALPQPLQVLDASAPGAGASAAPAPLAPPHKGPGRLLRGTHGAGDAGAAARMGARTKGSPSPPPPRPRAGPGGASPALHPIPSRSIPPSRAAGPGGRRCPTRPGELLSAGGSGHLVLRAGREVSAAGASWPAQPGRERRGRAGPPQAGPAALSGHTALRGAALRAESPFLPLCLPPSVRRR